MDMEQHEVPKDKWNFVFWIVFLIGFTILLPWNILITVEGFWNYKFRNVSLDSVNGTEDLPDSDLQKLFGSYVAIASNVPNATFIVLHAIIGHKISMTLKLYGSQVSITNCYSTYRRKHKLAKKFPFRNMKNFICKNLPGLFPKLIFFLI